MGINEVLDQCKTYLDTNTTLSISSKKKYMQIIRFFLLKTAMRFNVDDINAFISEANSTKNINTYKSAIRQLLFVIGKTEWLPQIVKSKNKPRKKQFQFIPLKTMQEVINHLPSKFRRIAFIQIKTGARFREAATIRIEDIDFNISDDLIYIYIGKHAKRKKERKLRISKKYEPYIRKWIKKEKGYLVIGEEYDNLDEEQVIKSLENLLKYYDTELNRVGKMFGIDHLSSHYLRHLFADYFMMANPYNKDGLQTIMGHARGETTDRYVSVADPLADRALIHMENGGV